MRTAVVKAVGEAGRPWAVVFDGTNELVPDTHFHVRRSFAEAEAAEFNMAHAPVEE